MELLLVAPRFGYVVNKLLLSMFCKKFLYHYYVILLWTCIIKL